EEHGVRYDDIVRLTDSQGRPLSVWGCVSVVSTLPHGSPEDVRRAVERHEDVLLTRAEDIMTRDPKVIDESALAAEALRWMETHSITSVLTTDGDGRTTGIIHLHDILKAGIL
ncbi:MAG: CBS domain-containing protein, partial [Nitrospinota bacterium]|nr:CBS domain-containing protein [Nitrospinota bacterium]